ncbi:MAG: GYD domain-containing protein [Aeromicrobium sp.]
MGKYLFRGSFTAEGLRGVMKDGGTSRPKAVAALAESVGGRMDAYYFAFGDDSYFVVCDLPNDQAAAACALAVSASGAVSNSTIKLLTPEEVDAATKLSPAYRAPGK